MRRLSRLDEAFHLEHMGLATDGIRYVRDAAPASIHPPMTARDPRLDPQPGDILRAYGEGFFRRILKRDADRVLVEMGANNHGWRKLASWQKWANRSAVVIASVAAAP